jgi:hypothetical protein
MTRCPSLRMLIGTGKALARDPIRTRRVTGSVRPEVSSVNDQPRKHSFIPDLVTEHTICLTQIHQTRGRLVTT